MDKPLISVILPVFNAETFLSDAIQSILNQTYKNLELIIINDGSTDGSLEVIKKFAKRDKRIAVINQKNKGLVATLNKGVSAANGKFIARQDADDISLPSRLEEQVDFLTANSNIDFCGTNYHVIDAHGEIIDTTNVFTAYDDIKLAEIFSNQFGHGTILANAKLLKKELYDPEYKYAEDYELWARLSHRTNLANLKEPLYKWRLHASGITATQTERMQFQVERIRQREFDYFLKNKGNYKFFSFHLFSLRYGPFAYLVKKSILYRDISLMYLLRNSRFIASLILLLALLHAPWEGESYRRLLIIATKKNRLSMADNEII